MVGKNTFNARLDLLSKRIGSGELVGSFWVDQAYAASEHVHHGEHHGYPGSPNFVSTPLSARHREWFADMARLMFRDGPVKGMIDGMEDLNNQLFALSPIMFGHLRRSGNFKVIDGGRIIADVPAPVERLGPGSRGQRYDR